MSLTVAAIRYTDDVPAMQAFLELLGLSPAVVSPGWVDLHAEAGRVWLHAASNSDSPSAPGQTNLCFESADLPALAERLGTTCVDETFGASLTIADPLGDEVQINSRHLDTYGYDARQADPEPMTTVVPIRFTDPTGPYGAFLLSLGLTAQDGGDAHFATYSGDNGFVGLHADDGTPVAGVAGARVHLSLSTGRDLTELARELQEAGHTDARVVDEGPLSSVHVTDPDRNPLQIYRA